MQSLNEWVTKVKLAAREAAIEAVDFAADDLQDDFENVSERWEHRVKFTQDWSESPHSYEVIIRPTGENKKIFGYVDQGTKPHLIQPLNPAMKLKFRTGYSPRTAYRGQTNVGTGQAYGGWISKAQVQHPGSKGRDFSGQLLEDLDPSLVRRVDKAVSEAVGE